MKYGFVGCIEEQVGLICECLGYGSNHTADKMLIETAWAETAMGGTNDRSPDVGMGLTQFDPATFNYIRQRSAKRRKKILNDLGIDIMLVDYEHLRYNPYISLLFTRLFYLTIEAPIPTTIKYRAKYWKRYYNTYLGKGTEEHYLKANHYVDSQSH